VSKYISLVLPAIILAWVVNLSGLSAQDILRPDELKPGMKGYGITVFKGEKLEKFDAEVIGVFKNWFPQGDVILVKLDHPVLRRSGVIAGMSGSPVYINGKLIGAIAYGWAYLKDPIAGVQPINQMFTTLNIDKTVYVTKKLADRGSLDRTRRLADYLIKQYYEADNADEKEVMVGIRNIFLPMRNQVAGDSDLRPLPGLLYVGGCGDKLDLVRRMMPGMHVVPVGNSGVSAKTDRKDTVELLDKKLQPGMPVGSALMSGDIDWTGMGTLTFVEGNRVLAFGHSMNNLGKVQLPLVVGRIVQVMPSVRHSFKLSATEGIVGTVTQDRDSAIAGRLGIAPPMIPVRFSLTGAVKRNYRVNIAVDKRITPLLMSYAFSMMSSYLQGDELERTFKSSVRIRIKGRKEPLRMDNTYSSASEMIFTNISLPISALMDNPFSKVRIAGLDVIANIIPEDRNARIISISTDAFYVTRGQEVEVTAVLRPKRGGGNKARKMKFKVPERVQAGSQIRLLVCGGSQSNVIDMSLRPGLRNPRNLEQLIRVLTKSEPGTNLVLRASVVKQGLSYNGEMMPALPPAVASALMASSETGLVEPLVEDRVTRTPTEWIITGSQGVSLQVIK